jgi:leader peptidase (prepilin peptidase)/N-methyltransferase
MSIWRSRPVGSLIAIARSGETVAGLWAAGASILPLAVLPLNKGIIGALFGALTAAIALIDRRHFIIPNSFNLAGALLGLLYVASKHGDLALNLLAACSRAAVAWVSFMALRSLYRLVRHKDGIGMGDVKLAAVAGIWLDWQALPVAVELSCVIALLTALLTRRSQVSRDLKLPFGMFFAPCIWATWLLTMLAN